MRHNRKAVMAERYKLYMKKNIFNGRYFVRNLQISICVVLAVALIIGAVVLAYSGKEEQTVTASADVNVKEALFSNGEEEKTVTKKKDMEESVTTAEEIAKADSTEEAPQKNISSEPVTDADNNIEDTTQPKEEIEKKSDFDGKCIANVEETLNIRKAPSTDAEFAGSMKRGAIAKVEGTEGEWTKIKSGDVEGYVLTQYILTGEDAEKLAKDYVTLRGTVLKDGVNIRKKESTDADILTVLDKDDTITVLEEPESKEQEKKEEPSQTVIAESDTEEKSGADTENTAEASTEETASKASVEESSETVTVEETSKASTEEKTSEKSTEQTEKKQKNVESAVQKDKKEEKESEIVWLCVMLEDGQRGYVSAELVDVESLYEIAVSAKELERKAAEEAAAKKAAEEEAARKAAAQTTTTNSGSERNSDSNSSDSYKGASTTPITAAESGECIGTFTITAYCGCKKCSGGGKKTASGTTPTEGRTIAADTSILPYGTQVVIDGIVYTVEDCGSGVNGNHIDIFFATHSKALAFGRKSMKVYKY